MSKSIEKRERPSDPPFPGADDPERLEPILDALDASDAVRKRAYEIAGVVEGTMWVVGVSRTTVAATAVFVAGEIEGDGFSQTAVADASASSAAAISVHRADLRDVYEQHRPEKRR